ncbi:uncharacterized protein I303_107639 [Kwoniella dejecticola CBS 10117]|uniref:Uncharacterized protein n=1 Tax=Kwoniella dejecticola CBS 10117 TaxID=1296121 RepID=A0A1A5ZVA9_9TREE|nr:uncharacterized protein I303_07650 [Kwoniella dejecticola CBS 10117]OBR81740.1 hypothetical protein I303_07650 [Kwoniella dejecticola CBS 10117]
MASVPTALGAVINKSEGTGTGTSIFHPRGPVAAQIWGTDEPSRKDMNNALGVDHDLGIKVSIAALLKDDDAEWIKSHIVTADGSPKTSGATISLYKGDNVQDYTFTTDKVAKTFQREQVETNWWWIGYEKAVLDALGADDNDEGKITEDQADPEKVLKILTGKKVSKKTDLSGSDYRE